MKKIRSYILICCSLLLLTVSACKSKPATTTSPASATTAASATPADKPKTTGKVSHAYSSCGTVIIVPDANGGDPMILIPNDPLGILDVEGLELSFHYRPLKKRNPDGCMKGFPASLSDISKK
jgi:hypothetical protein